MGSNHRDNVKIGVYVCYCGTNIGKTVNVPEVVEYAKRLPGVAIARDYKYMCADPGQTLIKEDIKNLGINRVVVASCSPHLHESTFRKATSEGGENPFYFHMANIREHVSWVTTDTKEATEKAKAIVAGAVHRVKFHKEYDKLLEEGVHFIRGKVAEVTDWAMTEKEEGKLTLRVEDTLVGVVRRIQVDMVVLSLGLEVGKKVIGIRREVRELMTFLTGKVIHPVWALPGGVVKGLTKTDQEKFIKTAESCVKFAEFTLQTFKELVLANKADVDLIISDTYTHKTYYMGLMDDQNKVNFYDGRIRVVDPNGNEYARFKAQEYPKFLAEHVEPWTYIKFLYLKDIGWKGFTDGADSGIYAVAPLARLNASTGMSTLKSQTAYEEYFETLGGKPVHHTLATHWARVIEIINAAERFLELAKDGEITSEKIRLVPTETPSEGVGVVEAPRGTLFHHYKSDGRGLVTESNLLVATQNNAARVAMSVDKAAKGLIKNGKVDDGILNMAEMAFRAYDPCNACGTHTLPGQFKPAINVRDREGKIILSV